jgi:CheY-like chemotaxis protein
MIEDPHGVHILLVEDNEADVDLARAMLASTKINTKFSVARDGVEAIEFLSGQGRSAEPDHPMLILLDLNLPRKDGRQVLAVLKGDEQLRRIPVIVLSSSDSEKDITNCYHLGANCYIIKPNDLTAYRTLVRTLEDYWLGSARLPRREGQS